jgi:hypothetical protein
MYGFVFLLSDPLVAGFPPRRPGFDRGVWSGGICGGQSGSFRKAINGIVNARQLHVHFKFITFVNLRFIICIYLEAMLVDGTL